MACGCGTRAGKWLRRIGYRRTPHTAHDDTWSLRGTRGAVLLSMSAHRHHAWLTIVATLLRLVLGYNRHDRTNA